MKKLHYFSLEIVKKLQNMKAAKKQSSGGLAANVINVKLCPKVARICTGKIRPRSCENIYMLLGLTDGRIKPNYK